MSNEIIKFEEKYVEQFNKLSELKKQKDALEKIEKSVKDEFEIKSVKTDKITITRVAESVTTSIDLKALEENEPECYKGLLEDYPKITTKKAYVKFTVK